MDQISLDNGSCDPTALIDLFRSVILLRGLGDLRRVRRRGVGIVEVIIILAIGFFAVLCVLIVLPRGRESARLVGCQKNLAQIGVAVLLYEQTFRQYPASALSDHGPSGRSPVETMLQGFLIPDFLDLHDPALKPKPTQSPDPRSRVAGLVCPSDLGSSSNPITTALSYRANAGADFAGMTGPLAPGSKVSAALVEGADGLSFTAGIAERLLGTGRDSFVSPANYREQPGPIAAPCTADGFSSDLWHGDAGSSWADPGWRSAIYGHAIPPGSALTCIASDGRTAALSASSAHPGRINVWMLDGSLRATTPTIDPVVWNALGSYRQPVMGLESTR